MAKTPTHWKQLPDRVRELFKQGKSDAEIALSLGITTAEARTLKTNVKEEARRVLTERVKALDSVGYSNSAIAQELKINESSVRRLLL